MTVKPILTLGDPLLRLKGEPVDSFGPYLHELIDDLTHTMRDAPGVGLAAPQIGVQRQVVVWDFGDDPLAIINPEIVESDGEWVYDEGCLSIPGVMAEVERAGKGLVLVLGGHEDDASLLRRIQAQPEPAILEGGEQVAAHGHLISHDFARLAQQLRHALPPLRRSWLLSDGRLSRAD